jgi:acetolactate synthase regulatory subunit
MQWSCDIICVGECISIPTDSSLSQGIGEAVILFVLRVLFSIPPTHWLGQGTQWSCDLFVVSVISITDLTVQVESRYDAVKVDIICVAECYLASTDSVQAESRYRAVKLDIICVASVI